jgi:hypothetical protein
MQQMGGDGPHAPAVEPDFSSFAMEVEKPGDRAISDGWEKQPHMVDRPIDS